MLASGFNPKRGSILVVFGVVGLGGWQSRVEGLGFCRFRFFGLGFEVSKG